MKMYRIWFTYTPIDQQPVFTERETAEYAARFDFDPHLVKPGCDFPLLDELGEQIGGVVEHV